MSRSPTAAPVAPAPPANSDILGFDYFAAQVTAPKPTPLAPAPVPVSHTPQPGPAPVPIPTPAPAQRAAPKPVVTSSSSEEEEEEEDSESFQSGSDDGPAPAPEEPRRERARSLHEREADGPPVDVSPSHIMALGNTPARFVQPVHRAGYLRKLNSTQRKFDTRYWVRSGLLAGPDRRSTSLLQKRKGREAKRCNECCPPESEANPAPRPKLPDGATCV